MLVVQLSGRSESQQSRKDHRAPTRARALRVPPAVDGRQGLIPN